MRGHRILAIAFVASLLGPQLGAQQSAGAPAEVEARLQALRASFEAADSVKQKRHLAAEALRLARLAGRDVDLEREMLLPLVDAAQETLQTGTPFPFAFDADGRAQPSQITSEFASWAQTSGLSLGGALQLAMYDQPLAIANLYGSADSLSIATFYDALQAENYFVATAGANALALIDHGAAVDEVIALSYEVPRDVAEVLAGALERFSDPDAQARAEDIQTGTNP